jgi:DNA replication protein DnaC
MNIVRTFPARFRNASLDSVDRQAFAPVLDYRDNIGLRVEAGEGLLLSGSVGIGKTYSIVALTRAAASGIAWTRPGSTVREHFTLHDWYFTTGPHLFERYANPYDSEKDETETLETIRWLILNDLGKEDRSGKLAQQVPYKLGRLLRARIENNLVTHITTNMLVVPDREHPEASIPEIYGESIASLIAEACNAYEVIGQDRRRSKSA